MSKRFQECNWLGKVWRYRFYIPIPFKYVWFMYIKVDNQIRGKNLWGLFIGAAQFNMNWSYTSEEVMERMNKHFKNYDNNVH